MSEVSGIRGGEALGQFPSLKGATSRALKLAQINIRRFKPDTRQTSGIHLHINSPVPDRPDSIDAKTDYRAHDSSDAADCG